MPKIKNMKLAGKTVSISNETVKFDSDGIGEIKSEDIYENVKNLANFYEVPKSKDKDKKDSTKDKKDDTESKKEGTEVKKDTKSSAKKK